MEKYRGAGSADRYWRINGRGRQPPEVSHWKVMPNAKVPCTWGPVITWRSVAASQERTDNSIQTEQRELRDNFWDLVAAGMDLRQWSQDGHSWCPSTVDICLDMSRSSAGFSWWSLGLVATVAHECFCILAL